MTVLSVSLFLLAVLFLSAVFFFVRLVMVAPRLFVMFFRIEARQPWGSKPATSFVFICNSIALDLAEKNLASSMA